MPMAPMASAPTRKPSATMRCGLCLSARVEPYRVPTMAPALSTSSKASEPFWPMIGSMIFGSQVFSE